MGWIGSCLLKGYFADVFSLKPTRFDYIDSLGGFSAFPRVVSFYAIHFFIPSLLTTK